MDWRPLMGLTPEDTGTPVERAIALAVLDAAVDEHERVVSKGGGW